jgi:hypothetical protein
MRKKVIVAIAQRTGISQKMRRITHPVTADSLHESPSPAHLGATGRGRAGLRLPSTGERAAVACGAQNPVQVVGSAHQGQVGKRLREIAQRFPREANLL